jgi:hypothetical protein
LERQIAESPEDFGFNENGNPLDDNKDSPEEMVARARRELAEAQVNLAKAQADLADIVA